MNIIQNLKETETALDQTHQARNEITGEVEQESPVALL